MSLSSGVQAALETILAGALQFPGLDCGGVYRTDLGDGSLVLVAHRGLPPEFIARVSHYPSDAPHIRILSRGAILYGHYSKLDLPLDAVREREGLRVLVSVPLMHQARLLGALNIASHTLDEVPADIQNALEVMARHSSAILARLLAESSLRESEERYRALAENSLDTIMRFGREHRSLYVNPIVEQYTGIASRDFIGKTPAELGFSEPLCRLWEEAIDRVFATAGVHRVEIQMPVGRWFDWLLMPELGHEGEVIAVATSARDITERKQVEAERAQLQQQLLQSQKMEAIGRLAGGVAHDFNNLLQGIAGHISLALLDLEPDSALAGTLREIATAADSATRLTHQLLAFGRKQLAEPAVLDPNAALGRLSEMLRRLIGEDIELQIVLARDCGCIRIDPAQFEQIFVNLVVNARDAMPGGGRIRIETRNVILEEDYCQKHVGMVAGPHVLLSVADTGSGIAPEHVDHVFEPFYSTKADGGGSGLGLATVFGIMQQNRGCIELGTELSHGTTFQAYFPRIPGHAQPSNRPPGHAFPTGDETIMLVEDDRVVRDLGIKVLQRLGYTVLPFANGAEALEAARHEAREIQLLMTDVVMPSMNGRELAEHLRQQRPDLKVLYTSGYSENVIGHDGALDEGIQFLGKPYTVQMLAEKLRQVLESK